MDDRGLRVEHEPLAAPPHDGQVPAPARDNQETIRCETNMS